MKKTLFLVCVAALATACTNEEPTFEQSGNVAKGIVFDTTIEGSTVANPEGNLLIIMGNILSFGMPKQTELICMLTM